MSTKRKSERSIIGSAESKSVLPCHSLNPALLKSLMVGGALLQSTVSFAVLAESPPQQIITAFYGQSEYDYFGDGESEISTDSKGISYAIELSDSWSVAAVYQESNGKERWLAFERDNLQAFSGANIESSGIGVATSWDAKSYTLNLSYNQSEAEEQSVTYLPRVIERLVSDTQVVDFSIENSVSLSSETSRNQWSLDWEVGVQQAIFDAAINEQINLEVPVLLSTDIELEQLSGFVNLAVSYWIEEEDYAITPFTSIAWNTELNTSGEQSVLLSRGGDARPVNLLDGRFSNEINVPDSGEWQVGVGLLFVDGWSADLIYTESVATDYSIRDVSLSLSFFF
jgi:hypothetical protein